MISSFSKVLVTKADFQNKETLTYLTSTLNYLLDAKIVPILNTNDAISHPECKDIEGAVNINDNDSLAARLATMTGSDLLLLMSDVEGVYNRPPSEQGSRLLHTFNPKKDGNISCGEKSNVGTGGMESKLNAAKFAVENNCSVIICNGKKSNAILDSVKGKKVGTFFTSETASFSVEALAMNARNGGRVMQNLSAEKRSNIIKDYARSLLDNVKAITEANNLDLDLAKKNSNITCIFY